MVSLPWAFLQTGIYFAFFYLMIMILQVLLSSVLYLKAREMCPFGPQSMQEVGFVILGRPSIFWISFIILINSIGLLIIFFSVFGDTAASMIAAIFYPTDSKLNHFVTTRGCWVLILAFLLIPFIMMRELAELKAVSIALFSAAILFVIIFILQLAIRGNDLSNMDKDYTSY